MKDIPVFTGTHGTASLILRQVPFSGCAYVIVRSLWSGAEAFLEECLGFCRAVGAEQVYASWELRELPAPHGYDMLQMQMEKKDLPRAEPVALTPVSAQSAEDYRMLYNACFRDVPNAVACTREDTKRLIREQTGFLVYRGTEAVALAEISRTGLEAIAVSPRAKGLGFPLAVTVLQMVPATTLALKVASVNTRARQLYERLGMEQTAVLSRWWKLL